MSSVSLIDYLVLKSPSGVKNKQTKKWQIISQHRVASHLPVVDGLTKINQSYLNQ